MKRLFASVVLALALGGTAATVRAQSVFVGPYPLATLTTATASIGGSLLSAATCTSGTATVAGATTSMVAIASPVTYPGDGIQWQAYVSSANTVTVKVCALALLTPGATVYNVRVIQ